MLLRDDDYDMDDAQQDLILKQYLPFRLAVVAHLMSQGFTQRHRDFEEITISEWRVIANLGHKEPQSAHEIGANAYLDKVQVSRAVSRLEKKEWIKREGDRHDRRRNLLTLTQKGRDLFHKLGKSALSYEEDVNGCLSTEEYAALDRILNKLSRRAESLI